MAQKRDRNIPPGVLDASRRTITNKTSKEVITWHKYGYETNGQLAEATIDVLPGGGPPLHYHTTYNEKFEGLEGQATLYVNDKVVKLNPGETLFVPMGTRHRFTSENGLVKLKGQVLPASAGFERSLYILFGLNNDDLAGPDGLPKSLVQMAIIGEMSDMRFPGLGGMFVNLLTKVLAWYGRVSGEEERLLQKYWD